MSGFSVSSTGIARLVSPVGEVGRWQNLLGDRVLRQAVALAPFGTTGRLKASIRRSPVQTVGAYRSRVKITADAPYALYVHEGTLPHTMPARTGPQGPYAPGRPVVWKKSPGGPRVGMFSMGPISHPGTRAQPFLRDALRAEINW